MSPSLNYPPLHQLFGFDRRDQVCPTMSLPTRSPVGVNVSMLCPGFDLKQRWTEILGAAAIEGWEQNGHHDFEEPSGNMLTVHWGLFSDLDNHPPYPEVSCPTLIVHGRDDALIPSRLSVEYAAGHKHIQCEVVSGDHNLHSAVERIRDHPARRRLKSRAGRKRPNR